MPSFSNPMRRHMNILNEGRQALLEANDYEAMFASLSSLLDTKHAHELSYMIQQVRKTLKRKDRIVWFLRQWRIGFMRRIIKDAKKGATGYSPEVIHKLVAPAEKSCSIYGERSGLGTSWAAKECDNVFSNATRYLQKFEHSLSMPIPAIQSTVFEYQSANSILNQFDELESDWAENVSGGVAPDDRDTVLLDCGNGYIWYNLNRPSCSDEGRSMGHCGNSPRNDTDDTILSLRKRDKTDGRASLKPYLTFILGIDGYLGEMKGRFNKSPNNAALEGVSPSNFNNEIASLLKLPIIKGLRGGGYEPQNNFKITDLPEDMREALYELKPEIAPFHWQIEKYGETLQIAHRIEDIFSHSGAGYRPEFVPARNVFVLDDYISIIEVILYHTSETNETPNIAHAAHQARGQAIGNKMFNIQSTPALYVKMLLAFRQNSSTLYDKFALSIAQKMLKPDEQPSQAITPEALVAIIQQWTHGGRDDEPHCEALNRAITFGRAKAMKDVAEDYIYEWSIALRVAPNKYGKYLAANVVYQDRRNDLKSPVHLTAPFATLAYITDAELMDASLKDLIKFADGPVFVMPNDAINIDVSLEKLMGGLERLFRM